MKPKRTRATLALALLAGALSSMPPTPAPKEAAPSEWPVERFVRNLDARLRADPDDAMTHYTLGRVHAFAFALERSTLLGGGTEDFTWLKDLDTQQDAPPAAEAATPTQQERFTHLAGGLEHLRRACALADTALHQLTLAWLLETGAEVAEQADTPALLELDEAALTPEERAAPRGLWIERSIAAYGRCLELVKTEGLVDDPMIQGPRGAMVEREALEAARRLIRARGVANDDEKTFLAAADARWKELEAHPTRRWITPILLSLSPNRALADLTWPAARVPFDLDGDGLDQAGPWITPEAGWLVWDPQDRGEILSGQQLFGSASGWLFFEDGYRVLDALDDDRDGQLRGAELTGIAVWFDNDSDGVSDLGEVTSVERLGIVALATEASEHLGHSPANPCGLELADGRLLPTWDWVLRAPEQ